MKKLALVVVLLAVPAVAYATGSATMSLKLGDGSQSVSKDPVGATWSGVIPVSLYIDSISGLPEGVANFGGVLSSTSSVFSVATGTQRTIGTSPWTSGDTWGSLFANGLSGAIPSTKDFGAAAAGGTATSMGNYTAADGALPWNVFTVNVTVTNALPGNYSLVIKDGYFGTTINDGVDVDPTGVAFVNGGGINLTVTPEPATMLLLAAAVPFLRRRSA